MGKLLNTPWVKFVAQATSYLFFLCVILAHGHVEQGKLCLSRVNDVQPLYRYYKQMRPNLTTGLQHIDTMCIRNHKPAAMEFLIVLWITGYSRVYVSWHSTAGQWRYHKPYAAPLTNKLLFEYNLIIRVTCDLSLNPIKDAMVWTLYW